MAEKYSLKRLNTGGQLHLPSALTPAQMSPTPNKQGLILPQTPSSLLKKKTLFPAKKIQHRVLQPVV
jgi:hypothetical protein